MWNHQYFRTLRHLLLFFIFSIFFFFSSFVCFIGVSVKSMETGTNETSAFEHSLILTLFIEWKRTFRIGFVIIVSRLFIDLYSNDSLALLFWFFIFLFFLMHFLRFFFWWCFLFLMNIFFFFFSLHWSCGIFKFYNGSDFV